MPVDKCYVYGVVHIFNSCIHRIHRKIWNILNYLLRKLQISFVKVTDYGTPPYTVSPRMDLVA